MAKVLLTNLTRSSVSLDLQLVGEEEALRRTIPVGGTIDVGDAATIDELNTSQAFKNLISAGTISARSEAELTDVPADILLNVGQDLGAPVVADPDRIVTAVQIADGAQSLAAQPDTPRNLTMTLTDGNNSVTATVVATGKDPLGRTVSETMEPDGAGGGKTLTGTKIFASVDSVEVSNTAGSAGGDNLEVGVGDVIGLPTDITNATAVKHTYLGAVLVTPDAVVAGESISGVDANGGTYDGSKQLRCYYNTGE